MALAIQHNQFGKMLGIEPWSNEIAIAAQTENESREWWAQQNMTKLRGDFMQRLKENQMEEFCTIVERPSRHVDSPGSIGMLHVDGAHNDEAIADVVKFARNVTAGGICVMDDLHWHGGGVTRAEMRLLQMGFVKLYPLETGAVYQRQR
jgi:hypothetical protein